MLPKSDSVLVRSSANVASRYPARHTFRKLIDEKLIGQKRTLLSDSAVARSRASETTLYPGNDTVLCEVACNVVSQRQGTWGRGEQPSRIRGLKEVVSKELLKSEVRSRTGVGGWISNRNLKHRLLTKRRAKL